jgi:hypothetical protein
MTEEEVMAALAKEPLRIHQLLRRISPSAPVEELHSLLVKMSDSRRVSYNIVSKLWAIAA